MLHIVLSHHGLLENGSPVTPCTREATVVHAMDNLGGKLGSFDRLEKGLQDGESWSRFDRAIVRLGLVRGRGEAPAPDEAARAVPARGLRRVARTDRRAPGGHGSSEPCGGPM